MKIFDIIKSIFTFFSITLAGMFGGQKEKGVRRFGIPSIAVLTGWSSWGWKALFYLLLIPILCMGYGHKSIFMQWFNNDTIVRIVYGATLGLPFMLFGWRRGLIACVALMIAFSIRAGSAGQVWGMDILIEDIVRYGALALLVIVNNLTARTT